MPRYVIPVFSGAHYIKPGSLNPCILSLVPLSSNLLTVTFIMNTTSGQTFFYIKTGPRIPWFISLHYLDIHQQYTGYMGNITALDDYPNIPWSHRSETLIFHHPLSHTRISWHGQWTGTPGMVSFYWMWRLTDISTFGSFDTIIH